ncbi:MAG: hypothetical protein KAJ62_01755, partial [Desulfobacteraceae bacterium]|nr:hypothetical protein [Desulfobacteraceae bacterium]
VIIARCLTEKNHQPHIYPSIIGLSPTRFFINTLIMKPVIFKGVMFCCKKQMNWLDKHCGCEICRREILTINFYWQDCPNNCEILEIVDSDQVIGISEGDTGSGKSKVTTNRRYTNFKGLLLSLIRKWRSK